MNNASENMNGWKEEYWGKQEKRGGRCETCGGEGVCEYVVGKIEEGKKKGKRKRGLMTCD